MGSKSASARSRRSGHGSFPLYEAIGAFGPKPTLAFYPIEVRFEPKADPGKLAAYREKRSIHAHPVSVIGCISLDRLLPSKAKMRVFMQSESHALTVTLVSSVAPICLDMPEPHI